jgi:quercetin 2,3-dioxygenase
MSTALLNVAPLGAPPWPTVDPFLFCVHHRDHYPAGNAAQGPATSLAGRQLGMDFEGKDGWRMYHGRTVPGFPQHPHRGFETVTLVRRGFIDHSDSLGATARFGAGDVQWLTAGGGIVHSEMFPLRDSGQPNPLELFQIWLNLPNHQKLVAPYFSMFWRHQVPKVQHVNAAGRTSMLTLVAGSLGAAQALTPPPNSWAARADSDLMIATLEFEAAGSELELPAAQSARTRRMLYVFGGSLRLDGQVLTNGMRAELRADQAVTVQGLEAADCLLLQGRPIGEPVAHYGPFVMNTQAELRTAFADYQRTQFGGWPWTDDAPVHPREAGRFARHADGRVEHPPE